MEKLLEFNIKKTKWFIYLDKSYSYTDKYYIYKAKLKKRASKYYSAKSYDACLQVIINLIHKNDNI
jgi:hypothetical protein